ncbi:toll-like receptor 5 [Spea bombifrons]|uniref:toll-like receptor 5 n=1 Tax=Spea bombifrons TaxID=233779 RepID=UPI00234BD4D0|nr:toll-like receptor 5 [Spea bombifrons]
MRVNVAKPIHAGQFVAWISSSRMRRKGIRIYHLVFVVQGLVSVRSDKAKCQTMDKVGFFSSCNLTEIPLVPTNAEVLQLSFNYILELNSTSFPALENLLLLYLDSQKTEKLTIRNHSFRNVPRLVVLDVSFNRMLVLDPEAFAGLSQLQTLSMYYNNLNGSILENDYFKDLISLELLDLSSNDITYLKPHPLFYYLYNFHLLDLKHNKISSICEGNLHSFERKYFVVMDITNNHLYKSDSTDWESCGKPFRNVAFDTLILSNNGLTVELAQHICNSLNGTKIMHLKLSSHIMGSDFGFHNFKNPDNATFVGLANSDLQILDLSNGRIFSLNPYVFANLTKLLLLNLAENKINLIAQYAFHGLNNLQHLNLSNNLIGEIYDRSFDGLENVLRLELQQNHIGPIQRHAFQNLKHLQFLDLRENAIKTMTFCERMPFVTYILLGGNKLKRVDSTGLQTSFLDLSGNFLLDLGDLYKILQSIQVDTVTLKLNRLSVCYPFFNITQNNSLTFLDLSENMIHLIWDGGQCLNVFHQLSKLQVLKLNNNHLSFLPEGIFHGLSSLEKLNLSSNFLVHLSPDLLPSNLEILDVSHNRLLSPNPDTFLSLRYLNITHNNFICDCRLVSFILWLNQTNTTELESPDDIYCLSPRHLLYSPLHVLIVDDCDEDLVLMPLRFTLFVLTTLIVVTFMTSVVIYRHLRWFCFGLYKMSVNGILDAPGPEGTGDMCQYDAYLCYNKKDFQWVQSAFLENLDSQYCEKNRLHFCFEERDFIPGEDHITNIRQAIWTSRKTICIVTKNFLKDGWCLEAFNHAQSRYFTDLKDVLIMVVVGRLSPFQLKRYEPIRAFVQRSPYLKWPEDSQDVDWFLGRLTYKVLREEKVAKKDTKAAKETPTLELQNIATIS